MSRILRRQYLCSWVPTFSKVWSYPPPSSLHNSTRLDSGHPSCANLLIRAFPQLCSSHEGQANKHSLVSPHLAGFPPLKSRCMQGLFAHFFLSLFVPVVDLCLFVCWVILLVACLDVGTSGLVAQVSELLEINDADQIAYMVRWVAWTCSVSEAKQGPLTSFFPINFFFEWEAILGHIIGFLASSYDDEEE